MRHWDVKSLSKALLSSNEKQLPVGELQPAAVLVLLTDSLYGLDVVLTRRAAHLRNHPGQISFPGGKAEDEDKNLIATALREAHEEIGLPYEHVKILGQFLGSETISQFKVTPIVAYSTFKQDWTVDSNEVQQVIKVPLDWLVDDKNWRIESAFFRQKKYRYHVCWWQKHLIWGATAELINNLRYILHKN